MLSCIHDLRTSLCFWKDFKAGASVAGGLLAGAGGVRAGLPFGLPGMCVGGAAGFVVGMTGGYFGFDQAVPFEAFRREFVYCARARCGVQCDPDRPSCWVDDQFFATKAEVFP